MQYIFICYAVPHSMVEKNKAVSVPGNKLALLFADCFKEVCDKLTCLTIPPQKASLRSKPHNSVLNGKALAPGIDTVEVEYFNFPIIKHLSIAMGVFSKLQNIIKNSPEKDICVITVNSNSCVSLPTLLLKRKHQFKTVIFLSDMPFDENHITGFLRKLVRALDNKIRVAALKSYDGCITGVDLMREEYFPDKKTVRIDPAVEVDGYNREIQKLGPLYRQEKETVDIVYTGSLNSNYNIPTLIQVAHELPSHYRMIFYGRGEFCEFVENEAEKSEKIIYGGYLDSQQIKAVQVRADVLITLLDTAKNISKYAVPSKIYDYLCTGVPVITSDVLSVPEEIREFTTVVDDHSAADIKEKILKITMEPVERELARSKAGQAREYIIKNCNWAVQHDRIIQYMSEFNKEHYHE